MNYSNWRNELGPYKTRNNLQRSNLLPKGRDPKITIKNSRPLLSPHSFPYCIYHILSHKIKTIVTICNN